MNNNDALSAQWHANFAKNNPGEYAKRYVAPALAAQQQRLAGDVLPMPPRLANDNRNLQIPDDPYTMSMIEQQWNDMVKRGNQPSLQLLPGGKPEGRAMGGPVSGPGIFTLGDPTSLAAPAIPFAGPGANTPDMPGMQRQLQQPNAPFEFQPMGQNAPANPNANPSANGLPQINADPLRQVTMNQDQPFEGLGTWQPGQNNSNGMGNAPSLGNNTNTNALFTTIMQALSKANPGINLGDFGMGSGSSIYGGGRAKGGPVRGYRDYVVGEKGPEILRMPRGSSGYVIPNNALAGARADGGPVGDYASIFDEANRTPIGAAYQPDYSGASDMMLDPAGAGLNEMDPGGAQGRYNKQGNMLGTMGAFANPLLSSAGGGLLSALSPTPAGAGEPTPQAAAAKNAQVQDWGGSDEQNARINALLTRIDSLNLQKSDIIKGLGASSSTVTGRGKRTSTTNSKEEASPEAIAAATSGLDNQINTAQGQIADIKAEIKKTAPFAIREPETNDFYTRLGPRLSGATGFLGGLAAGANPSPVGRLLLSAGTGLIGAVEGAGVGGMPVYEDLRLPAGTRGRMAAENEIPGWLPEGARPLLGPWLSRPAQLEAGADALYAAGGANFGNVLRTMGGSALNAMRAPRAAANALTPANQAPAVPPAPAAAPGRPAPVYKDAQGRDIYLGSNGKPMFQNKSGIFQYPHGPIVRKEHRPF